MSEEQLTCKCVESDYVVGSDGCYITDTWGMPQRNVNRSNCELHKRALLISLGLKPRKKESPSD